MSNLSQMISRPLDSLDDPVIPVGTWSATIKGGKVFDTKTSEKSGNEYRKVSLALKLNSPGHDVDASDGVEKFVGETVYFEEFVMDEAGARKVLRTLKAIGATVELGGDTFDVISSAIASAKGIEINAEVSQEMYNNAPRTKVKKIYSLEAA